MGKSNEIKPTDGRRNNKRKKSIPLKPVPQGERSNKPALNKAKKSRQKTYAKKAIKNVFGSEVAMFESMAKKAKDGSYNHMKLLTDIAYKEEGDGRPVGNNAPVLNFYNTSEPQKKIEEKTIDITHTEEDE